MGKNKTAKVITIIILTLIIAITNINTIYASNPIDNPNDYQPGTVENKDIEALADKVNPIIGAISTIGIVVSVITLTVLGIKYMIGSVEERAEYKKTMSLYIIGIVLLLGISTVLRIINSIVASLAD